MTRLFFIYFDFYLFDISRKHPLIEKKFLLSAEISAKIHKKPARLMPHRLSCIMIDYFAASSVACTASAVLAACTFTAVAGLVIGTPIEVSSAVLEVL